MNRRFGETDFEWRQRRIAIWYYAGFLAVLSLAAFIFGLVMFSWI
jgi:hypothetical protein